MAGVGRIERIVDVELGRDGFLAAGQMEKDGSRGFPLQVRRAQDDGGAPPGSLGEKLPQGLRVEPGAKGKSGQQEREGAFAGRADEQEIVETCPLLESKGETARE